MKQLPFITIVSGLPRSGTSMMMQLVEAGGIPALADHLRTKDEDNPRGYYEFEPVKKTRDDPSWVPGARGKVVKMVYRLLYDLPDDQEYRVIFMRRNIDEVLASQKKMLQRSGKQGAAISDEKLKELFVAELEKFERWIATKTNFSILSVDYREMIASPETQCKRINGFLGGALDYDRAAAAVDPSLYRNRS
jgi:hypothetical protein